MRECLCEPLLVLLFSSTTWLNWRLRIRRTGACGHRIALLPSGMLKTSCAEKESASTLLGSRNLNFFSLYSSLLCAQLPLRFANPFFFSSLMPYRLSNTARMIAPLFFRIRHQLCICSQWSFAFVLLPTNGQSHPRRGLFSDFRDNLPKFGSGA